MDLNGGFKKTFGGTTFDIGVLYYVYPKTKLAGDPTSSDFVEPYFDIAHTFGPITAKAQPSTIPPSKRHWRSNQVGPKQDNVYTAGDFSGGIPNTPISLSAHIGHTFGPSWLSIGNGYTDWNLGASLYLEGADLYGAYVDTDGDFITPSGKNASKAGFVGSVTASF